VIEKDDYVRLPHYLGEHRRKVVESRFGGTSLTVRVEPPGNAMGWWLMTLPASQVKPELPPEPYEVGFIKCVNGRMFVRTDATTPRHWVEVTNVRSSIGTDSMHPMQYSWKEICSLTQ
jgi:hypothetical protein